MQRKCIYQEIKRIKDHYAKTFFLQFLCNFYKKEAESYKLNNTNYHFQAFLGSKKAKIALPTEPKARGSNPLWRAKKELLEPIEQFFFYPNRSVARFGISSSKKCLYIISAKAVYKTPSASI